MCEADEYVENHTCAMCPAETTNVAGDLAIGEDTICDDDCSGSVGVYCFEFEDAFIKSSNPNIGDYFGDAVALSGDTLAVGAYAEGSSATGVGGEQLDENAFRAGAVYVFRKTNGVWEQEAYIKASNTGEDDNFGRSVAIDGDTLVVGAYNEQSNATGVDGDGSDNSLRKAGAAYVFRYDGSTWSQEAYLKASNPDDDDLFGSAVDISGTTIVVSAPGEDSNATGVDGNQANDSAPNSGAAYVFTRENNAWSQQAYIKASNTAGQTSFGHSVALEGDQLAISSPRERSGSTGIDGPQDNNDAPNSGAVYIFARSNGTWSQQSYIKASNAESLDRFGSAMDWHGDLLAVSATDEPSNAAGVDGDQTDNSLEKAGAVYLFRQTNGVWTQEAYLKASNPDIDDEFGGAVAVWGDLVVVGADRESSNAMGLAGDQSNNDRENSGATYLFKRSGGAWSQIAYMKASTSTQNIFYGAAIAIDNGLLTVGAFGERSDATGVNGAIGGSPLPNTGAAFVYKIAP